MGTVSITPQHTSLGLGYRAPLLAGERGTAQTIAVMRKLIDQAQSDAQFVRLASDIVHSVPAFDEIGEVNALFQFVQQNIRFTKDPVSKETLFPPQELLKRQAGDCDDFSMLIAALAMAAGYNARLVTVAANPEYPDDFSHVYVEVEVGGNWIPMDAARPGAQFGLEPAAIYRKRAWSLTDSSYQNLGSYLGDLGDFSDINWGDIIQQGIQEAPSIVAVASGQPGQFRLPGGAYSMTGSPYGSFMTPYSPGYGIPGGGYLPQVSSNLFSSALPWILVAVVGLAVFKR